MISVGDILSPVSEILNDTDFVRWTKPELLAWINHAASEVVVRRPAAGAKVSTFECQAGAYQQVDAVQVLDVLRNTDGRPISRVERYFLDSADPAWMTGKAGPSRHFSYDDRVPAGFWVYPPAAEGHKLEVLASNAPTVESENDSLDLSPEYLSPVINYVLWRALGKDSEYANGSVAATYYQAFEAALGTQNQVTGAASPNRGMP